VISSVQFDSGSIDSDFSKLSKIALQSGGRVYSARIDNLERVYAEIAKDIRSHHQLMFSAADVENPRIWRNIRLSTTRPGATIFARTGYCPETPCQKSDGSFVGRQPETWNDVLAISRDAGVVSSVRRRFQELKFKYTIETKNIVKDLATDPLLIEKVWNVDGKRSRKTDQPSFTVRRLGNGNRLVSIDAEVCGITVDSESSSSPQVHVTDNSSTTRQSEPFLTVVNPEIRIARRPGPEPDGFSAEQQAYFQSQAIFYLQDLSGRIPSRIRVQCNRPHFLIGDGLVQFAVQALEQGLKVRSTRSGEAIDH
jgi:hypothetical protein